MFRSCIETATKVKQLVTQIAIKAPQLEIIIIFLHLYKHKISIKRPYIKVDN